MRLELNPERRRGHSKELLLTENMSMKNPVVIAYDNQSVRARLLDFAYSLKKSPANSIISKWIQLINHLQTHLMPLK